MLDGFKLSVKMRGAGNNSAAVPAVDDGTEEVEFVVRESGAQTALSSGSVDRSVEAGSSDQPELAATTESPASSSPASTDLASSKKSEETNQAQNKADGTVQNASGSDSHGSGQDHSDVTEPASSTQHEKVAPVAQPKRSGKQVKKMKKQDVKKTNKTK